MMRRTLPFLLCIITLLTSAIPLRAQNETKYSTQVILPQLNTLEVYADDNELAYPNIELNSDQTIHISFDDLSNELNTYFIKLIHCTADWTNSNLSTLEYINGFEKTTLDDYVSSQGVISLYTHFEYSIPNEDYSIKLSGNYALLISHDQDFNHPDAVACFRVYDKKIDCTGRIDANTTKGIRKKHQQLNFSLDFTDYPIDNPTNELKIQVLQNNRADNARIDVQPTYTSQVSQRFENNPMLCFEGGNQYRSIDISSPYTYGGGIDSIRFQDSTYTVYLQNAQARTTQQSLPDANGRYIINVQGNDYPTIEAEYMLIHFILKQEQPYFDKKVCLVGDFFQHGTAQSAYLTYDFKQKAYGVTLWLKQGGYNFLYATQQLDHAFQLSEYEGNFWQTENIYCIYVYQRTFGAHYDQLIGCFYIQ